ncbi:MAG: histidinol-phosphate transaminase [Patescibacteria group bacterium]
MSNTGKMRKGQIDVAAFHGGSFWEKFKYDFSRISELGHTIIPADVLDAWYPPAPAVSQVLRKHLEHIIHTSPPARPQSLIKTISQTREVPERLISCGTGSSQLIFLLLEILFTQKDLAMIIDPMYGEYLHVMEKVVGCKIVSHALKPENNFQVSLSQLIKDVIQHKPKVVVIVNPNSPAGTYMTRAQVQEFIAAVPKNTMIIVDETYIEYVGHHESCETLVDQHPNLCILKSMSKIYALSGLRVGYLIANASITKSLILRIPPWSVSLPGQMAAIAAISNWKYYAKKIEKTHKLEKLLFRELAKLPGLVTFPSVTNFILCQLKKISASLLIEKLKDKGVYIRNCDSMSKQFHNHFVRITVLDQESNNRVLHAIKGILG